jgi:hypothetical protein
MEITCDTQAGDFVPRTLMDWHGIELELPSFLAEELININAE